LLYHRIKQTIVLPLFLHLTHGDDLFSAVMFKYVCIQHENAIVTSHHQYISGDYISTASDHAVIK